MAFNKEQFIADLEAMTVLELKELVSALEEHFGVTAAAPVAVAANCCCTSSCSCCWTSRSC